ncbi:MAG: hypothetical protein MUE51_04585 [Thermoleophilia bacterium]|jgi:hypothetical protein|nr:hypothetical protein [Thermoleophilia bacterium]
MRRALAAALAGIVLTALAGPALGRTRATLEPDPVRAGGALLVQGTGWAPGAAVSLLAGPPRSEGLPVRRVRASAAGAFRVRIPVARSAVPGRYVMVVCQRSCRVKVTLPFRVVRR